MQYFDRMLSEVLAEPALAGGRLTGEIDRLMTMWGNERDQDKKDLIADEITGLRTEDNAEEWDEYLAEICDRNINNDEFKKAIEKRSQRGDNLATWMLRHLVDRARSSQRA